MSAQAVCRLNALRLARTHLEAQLEEGIDTPHATCAEAQKALTAVEAELTELEAGLRKTPGCEYLFPRRRRRR